MIHLRGDDGREGKLSVESPALLHCAYAFNVTVTDIQNKSIGNIIVATESSTIDVEIMKATSEAIGRSDVSIVMVTDDIDKVNEQLVHSGGVPLAFSGNGKELLDSQLGIEIKKSFRKKTRAAASNSKEKRAQARDESLASMVQKQRLVKSMDTVIELQ